FCTPVSRTWTTALSLHDALPILKRFNLHSAETELEGDEPDGYLTGANRFGKQIGGSLIGGTVYDLPPGEAICPYHFEYGDEEWLDRKSTRLNSSQQIKSYAVFRL